MKKNGFTLIELVVVMALIALLSLMIVGGIILARNMVIETKHRNNGKAIQAGMERWYASHRRYPNNTSAEMLADPLFSFKEAADFLNVEIESTSMEATACKDGTDGTTLGAFGGGGAVVTNANGTAYTLYVRNYNCSAITGDRYTEPK